MVRAAAGPAMRSTLAGVWLVGSLPVLVSLHLAGSLTEHQSGSRGLGRVLLTT
jgi:hypothetical protein